MNGETPASDPSKIDLHKLIDEIVAKQIRDRYPLNEVIKSVIEQLNRSPLFDQLSGIAMNKLFSLMVDSVFAKVGPELDQLILKRFDDRMDQIMLVARGTRARRQTKGPLRPKPT